MGTGASSAVSPLGVDELGTIKKEFQQMIQDHVPDKEIFDRMKQVSLQPLDRVGYLTPRPFVDLWRETQQRSNRVSAYDDSGIEKEKESFGLCERLGRWKAG